MRVILITLLLLTHIKTNSLEQTKILPLSIEISLPIEEEVCIFTEEEALSFLIEQEGWNKGDWDYRQYTTGYGTKALYPGEEITKTEALKRLKKAYRKRYRYICRTYPSLSESKKRILTCFIYNTAIGEGLHTLLIEDRIEEAGIKLLAYNKAGGVKLKGLVKRRNKEKLLWDNYK